MEYVPCKHLIIRNRDTSWFGTDHTMNIYRGCPHGCIYCDSRSECYQNEDFDRVRVKENALEILRDDLRRKIRPGVVGTGSMSDPYHPLEERLQLTRNALALLDAYGFGVAIATKSDLIVRDIDVLTLLHAHAPVLCKLTVTTCDDALAARLEPGAPSPTRRLEAVRRLSQAGPARLCPSHACAALPGGYGGKCAGGGGTGGGGWGAVYLPRVRHDPAGQAEGLVLSGAGDALSRPGPGGEKSPCLWEPVLVCKPPGKTSVGSVFRAVPGAGPPL